MSANSELAQARKDYADNKKTAKPTPVREEHGTSGQQPRRGSDRR